MEYVEIAGECPSGQALTIETDSPDMASSLVEYLMGVVPPDVFLTYIESLQPDALPVAQMAVNMCEMALTAAIGN